MEKFILDNNLRVKYKQNIRETVIQKYDQKDVWNATINEYHLIINQFYSKI